MGKAVTTGTREALEDCIARLASLIKDPDVNEDCFQEFLENHPIAFEVMGYVRTIPHPELPLAGHGPMRPDFVAMRPDGLWEIIELKRPDTAVLRNVDRRTVFYSDMGTYIAQCQEYSERCSQVPVRQNLADTYGIDMNSQPACVLVAGRSEGLDRLRVHEVLKRSNIRVSHQTYDDLLETLQRHYEQSYGGLSGRGVSVYAFLLLTKPEPRATESLFDLGTSETKNRISLARIGKTTLTFSVIDSAGMRTIQDVDLAQYSNGVGFICGIHVVHSPNATLVLFEINGTYAAEHRLTSTALTLAHPIPVVVGADFNGGSRASMIFGEFLTRDPPLNVTEKLQLREYLFEKHYPQLRTPPDLSKARGVRFSGGQYMCTEGHPRLDATYSATTNLVQRNDAERPIAAG